MQKLLNSKTNEIIAITKEVEKKHPYLKGTIDENGKIAIKENFKMFDFYFTLEQLIKLVKSKISSIDNDLLLNTFPSASDKMMLKDIRASKQLLLAKLQEIQYPNS